jgi:hypothetical protein
VVRDLLRLIDFADSQPACLTSGLDRKITHTENSLIDPLVDRQVLDPGDQDRPRCSIQKPGFISEFVVEDGHSSQAVSDVLFQRPQQKEHGYPWNP